MKISILKLYANDASRCMTYCFYNVVQTKQHFKERQTSVICLHFLDSISKGKKWISNNHKIYVVESVSLFELTLHCLNLSDKKNGNISMWIAWKHINISSTIVLLPASLQNFAYLVIWGILFWLFFMHNSLIFVGHFKTRKYTFKWEIITEQHY